MKEYAKIIVSKAHEVVQTNDGKQLTCMRCGLTGPLKTLFGTIRCTPHYESKTSGWKDEVDSNEIHS